MPALLWLIFSWYVCPFMFPLLRAFCRKWYNTEICLGSNHHCAIYRVQFSSVTQSCLALCDPMNCRWPGLPVQCQPPEYTQTHVHQVSDTSNYLILCHPLLLLPSIPPSITVFSNESTLHMRWPKYWSFSSASVLPMNT